MKTTLPQRSLIVKDRLDAIVKEILAAGKEKIAMIILFGSYARGDWVKDTYTEGHITYSYISDLDILLVLKKKKHAGYQAVNLRRKIEQRLERKFPVSKYPSHVIYEQPSVTIVLEPIDRVNEQLTKGRYFFADIKKEGVLLYDSGEYELVEAKNLSREERRLIAQDDYEQWFQSGSEFLAYAEIALGRNELKKGAFFLHQASESFYNAILLVFSGYKKKEHNILELVKEARSYNPELFKIFPLDTPELEECFELLKNAYVKARYDKKYQITKEQLLYLIGRVEQLKKITEKICLEKING